MFDKYEELATEERQFLLQSADSFDPKMVNELYSKLVAKADKKDDAEQGEAQLSRVSEDLIYSIENETQAIRDAMNMYMANAKEEDEAPIKYVYKGLDLIK